MKRRRSEIALAGMALAAAASLLTAAEQGPVEGKRAFSEQKCSMCHAVEAAGIKATARSEKMKGPDLSAYKTELELPALAAYLRRESAIDGTRHIKPFKGSDEELQAIVDWLGSLEAE